MDGGDIGEPTSTDEDTTVNDETTEVDGLAQNNQTELAYMHKGNRIMVEKTEVRKRRPG